jgi:transglutaminase-like putative cysteine protease
VWDLESLSSGASFWDTTIYRLLAAFTAWSVALFAVWYIYRRRQALIGLLPSGALLSLLALFHRPADMYLVAFLFCMLWLLALVQLWLRWDRWDLHDTDYPDNLGLEVALNLAPWVFLLVLVGGVVPNKGFWTASRAIWDRVEAVWGPLDSDYPGGPATGGGMPRAHLLGSGPELAATVVLYVATNDPTPPEPIPGELDEASPATTRRYWRGTTYDVYTGVGWASSPLQTRESPAGQLLAPGARPGFELFQKFELVAAQGAYLYAANAPVRADHNVETRWRSPGDLADLLRGIDRYAVISNTPHTTVSDLRLRPTATTALPPDTAARYLQVPEGLPQRVRDLSLEVTAGATTDFDRAAAIESYLRAYTYTLDLPRSPDDRDMVDYFLFDLQKGYCDYYASAMVVMARVAGVPARFATGYAQGSYDHSASRWVVTEKDGHSWVEVYFEGIGWVEFEPTAGQPALYRPGGSLTKPSALPPIPPRPRGWWQRVPWTELLLSCVPFLLLATITRIWLSGRRRDADAAGLVRERHQRLIRWGGRMGQPLRDGQTLQEYSAVLGSTLYARGRTSIWAPVRRAGLQAPLEVELLIEVFSRAQYGAGPIANRDAWQVRDRWLRLRPHLLWLWLGGKRG